MKFQIPKKCIDCSFCTLHLYDYYKCILYKKLRRKYELEIKPDWCKAKEVFVEEVN